MLPHPASIFFICSVILTAAQRDVGLVLRLGRRRRSRLPAGLLCLAMWLVGCAAVPGPPPPRGSGAELALSAIGLVGLPYRYGGDDPASGFDCSGLVRYVSRTALGIRLPRQTEAISRVGVEVELPHLQPGDLVFFNTLGRPYSHVGVYLGEGQFVHAPTRGGNVRIERMSQTYWRTRFDGARRLQGVIDPRPAVVSTVSGAGSLPAAAVVSGTIEP